MAVKRNDPYRLGGFEALKKIFAAREFWF